MQAGDNLGSRVTILASDDPSTKLLGIDLSQVGQDDPGQVENHEGGAEGIFVSAWTRKGRT